MPDIQFSLLNTKVKPLLLDFIVYSHSTTTQQTLEEVRRLVRAATNQEKKKVAFRKKENMIKNYYRLAIQMPLKQSLWTTGHTSSSL